MATQTETQLFNQNLFDMLADDGMRKTAEDAINDFTRTRIREDGFFRRLMPPLDISNDQLDRQIHTDKPIKIVDKEPQSPPSISVPFGTLPINYYIKGPRYAVGFSRILTNQFAKDLSELRTWIMDIRQVISDNAIKDMLAEEDGKFLAAVNTALIGEGSVTPTSGVVQWKAIPGGITRETLAESWKVMPSTPFHLVATTCLMNNITVNDFLKWGRDEAGGDLSQDLLKNGWTERRMFDRDWIITIKTNLVADSTVYQFADPKFIGKSYQLEPVQMYAKRKAWMIYFFSWEELGAALGHTGGLAKIRFA